jgi:polyketide synthase PksJ
LSVLVDGHGYFGIDCRRLSLREPDTIRARLEVLTAEVESGAIRPLPIAAIFEFRDARRAFECLEERQAMGRILLVPDGETTERQGGETLEAFGAGVASLPRFEEASVRACADAPVSVAARACRASEAIAIIGMSGRFPGAQDLEAFWANLAEGRECVSELRPERWRLPSLHADAADGGFAWRAGLLEGMDEFDAPFFGMARAEAEQMDPQHRLFLQEAWRALEDAGYARTDGDGVRGGIYVGVIPSEYGRRAGSTEAHSLSGTLGSGLTGRLAYLLNWSGPALALDTACSSSLAALHLACASLGRGECDMALVGGVHVTSGPNIFRSVGSMGLLSREGTGRVFDAASDGWVMGEAVGAVVLKRLSDAERDGDSIRAVLRGIGVNQDGAKNGFTAPKASAQTALQLEVYEKSGVDPGTIGYVEVHGMSTVLGDEVELMGLRESFGRFTNRKGFCALGTLKPNIGHPIAAAGIACLMKVVMALQKRQLPPVIGVRELNPALQLESSPFHLNTIRQDWTHHAGLHPRRAAINGLSATGTNAHVVLEEYAPRGAGVRRATLQQGPVLIVLSASDRGRLQEMAANLSAFLDARADIDLHDLAFTLQVGRRAMPERLAFTADSREAVQRRLRGFCSGQESRVLLSGRCESPDSACAMLVSGAEGREFVSALLRNGSLEKLAQLWIAGITLDWTLLYKERPRRISLPTYPFQRERYWQSEAAPDSQWPGVEPGVRSAVSADASGPSLREPVRSVAELLRAVVAEVLRCAPASIALDEDLQRHGFDSLYTVRVAERFAKATGYRLAPRTFFECRTLADLAQRIERESGGNLEIRDGQGGNSPAEAVGSAEPRRESPEMAFGLTEAQQALWHIQQADPGGTAYHVPVALSWPERMSADSLRAALQRLVEVHPSLRTSFHRDGARLYQRVRAPGTISVPIGMLEFPCVEGEALAAQLSGPISEPFDLEKPPLMRAWIIRAGERDYLLLVLHHLVVDGHSLGLLLPELEKEYWRAECGMRSAKERNLSPVLMDQGGTRNAECGTNPHPSGGREGRIEREVRRSAQARDGFRGQVEEETAYLASADAARDREYWVAHFQTGFGSWELPGPEGEVAPHLRRNGAVRSLDISAETMAGLRVLAERDRVSLQSLGLAAFQMALSACVRSDEIVVGIAVDDRRRDEFRNLVGYAVNLLPVRATLRPGQPLREVARLVFDECLKALEHRHFPFRGLARVLAEAGHGQRSYQLPVAFYFQTWRNDEARQLAGRMVPGVHQAGELPLVYELVEGTTAWQLNIKYQPWKVSREALDAITGDFLELLNAMARHPNRPWDECLGRDSAPEGMSRDEAGAFEYPQRCVHALIEATAARKPDAVAVVHGGGSITYRELNERSNRLAQYLVRSGLNSGSLVGVLVDRSLDMLIALLAVWKAGGAYVPLDPGYPEDRLRYVIEDGGMGWLLTESAIRTVVPGVRRVELDVEASRIAAHPPSAPASGDRPVSSPAYVIYTSGSTGWPKGVQVSHRSLAHFLSCMARRPGCTEADRVLAITTISFDIAALELFLPLVTGGSVEIVPASVARSGRPLRACIEASAATIIQATPATWRMLLAAELGPRRGVKALCGGEAWDTSLAEHLLERFDEVWNMYGPTETTVWSSVQKVEPGGRLSLGEPIGNTRFYVLDESLKPVPRGAIGELYIGGDGLADGYLNRPDLTRERFIPHPDNAEELIYRTGDLVRHV